MNLIYIGENIFRNSLYFRICAIFGADVETDKSSISGKKTTIIYKHNPVCNGYYMVSEIDDVLKSGHYEFPLENVNVG